MLNLESFQKWKRGNGSGTYVIVFEKLPLVRVGKLQNGINSFALNPDSCLLYSLVNGEN